MKKLVQGVVIVAAVVGFMRFLPDLVRYMKIRNM